MQAIVLAAGRGTRMRGLCDAVPKPMLPVANRPVLDVIVQRLAIAGIDRVFLVVGHLASHIQNHFRQFPPPPP
ncbi:MAG TPA: NTP transferase domain-containing protein, partial [Candidatus Brocadiia bacterium]|nr:NTP transferase domain-containing protein [Candidatus Brocadiia bacterium]